MNQTWYTLKLLPPVLRDPATSLSMAYHGARQPLRNHGLPLAAKACRRMLAPTSILRRAMIRTTAAVCLLAAGLRDETRADERAVVNVPETSGRAAVVGAYYYPWYSVGGRSGEGDWRNVLRRRLAPPQSPLLGAYRSDDPDTISEHLKQSRRAGLAFWAVSWWGPNSTTDQVFRDAILPHADAGEFRFAALYESTGRLGEFRSPDYKNWLADLQHLSTHCFGHPNYLKINDRPVVFVYLSREYFRDQGEEALAQCREQFPEVFLVGDDVFGSNYQPKWAAQFDAVTVYDVYGQSTGAHGATTKAVDVLAQNYAAAKSAANSVGAGFIPAIAPGYNDSAVRRGHRGTARYLTDQAGSQEGDLFRAMLAKAALPNVDDRTGRMAMVTSFNEWYEDTQIEPTSGTQQPTNKDNSPTGRKLTYGDRYEDYGTLYLDILRESLARGEGAP